MHAIRLRSPWLLIPREHWTSSQTKSGAAEYEVEHLADQEPREIATPGDWGDVLGPEFRGRVQYLRRFGLPTNLSPDEGVSLVVERVDWQAEVSLNGQILGRLTYADGLGRYDITHLLKPRNELVLLIELPPWDAIHEPAGRSDRQGLPGGLLGEVRLEIASPG